VVRNLRARLAPGVPLLMSSGQIQSLGPARSQFSHAVSNALSGMGTGRPDGNELKPFGMGSVRLERDQLKLGVP